MIAEKVLADGAGGGARTNSFKHATFLKPLGGSPLKKKKKPVTFAEFIFLLVTETVVSNLPVDATESKDSDELIVTESVVSKAPVDATDSSEETNQTSAWVHLTIGAVSGIVLALICAGVILFSRRCLSQERPTPAPEPYTALDLVSMSNDDVITAENYATPRRMPANIVHEGTMDEDMSRRSGDDVTHSHRCSALYDEIQDRNLHIETGNDVISSEYT